MFTDASNQGFGAVLDTEQIQGSWEEKERDLHINTLEMRAIQYALYNFKDRVRGQTVLAKSDNLTVVSYINKEGGTRSKNLCYLTLEILEWCDAINTRIMASYIPGKGQLHCRLPLPGELSPIRVATRPNNCRTNIHQ